MLYESEYYGVSSLGDDQLEHHGIKGQKWGVRKYQYEDGLLTPAGRARYDVGPAELKSKRKIAKRLNAADNMISDAKYVERRASRKIAKYEKKLSKLEGKDSGRAQRKAEKLNNKLSAEKQTRKSAIKTQKDVSNVRDEVIRKATKAGFDITSKPKYKDAESSKKLIMSALVGSTATTVASLANRDSVVRGNTFKVKKSKTGKGTYTNKSKGSGSKAGEVGKVLADQTKRDLALNTAGYILGNTAYYLYKRR